MTAHAGAIAVIDVETTGLFPLRHDRVVEVAAVVVQPDGEIEREFTTLVNPERDIGPTSIHGLTAEEVLGAPCFREVAPALVQALDGCVAIAAHNVRFDRQFLECEFTRIGYAFPDCYALCTLQLAGGKLVDCCRDFGVPLDDAHQALADARAAAGLLVCLLREASDRREVLTRLPPISWPALTMEGKPPYPRSEARRRWAEPPGYVARLLTLVRGRPAAMELPEAALAYRELLDRVLEDRRVEDAEADALVEIAQRWGLAGQEIDQFHRKYLDALAAAAVADGTVSNSEQRDLAHVARLLGLQGVDLGAVLDQAARTAAAQNIPAPSCEARPIGGSVESLAGQTVCFTGELQCSICGELITREQAEEFARNAGLKTAGSVTKALNILVVADPNTQSGKAKKARQYGVRVLHEPVFWKSLGISVE